MQHRELGTSGSKKLWEASSAKARNQARPEIGFPESAHSYEIRLERMPKGMTVAKELTGGLDLIQLFANDRATLEMEFPGLRERIKQDGMIWVSWPKSSSKLRTDLNGNVVKNLGLKNGLGM